MDFMLFNETMTDIRLKMYERQFPGSVADIGKIFGTELPSPKEVSEWKCNWVEKTENRFIINKNDNFYDDGNIDRVKCHKVCKHIGVHPYFWEHWRAHNNSQEYDHLKIASQISFFFEEHLIMFKLAWEG